jgi:hypothetical protein
MIKSLRIAAVTLLAVGGLGVCAANTSAAVPTRFPAPPTGDNPGSATGGTLDSPADPISLGPLNVAVPAVGLL